MSESGKAGVAETTAATARELAALRYMSSLMGTTAFLVGKVMCDAGVASGGYQAVGAATLGSLRSRGLVMPIEAGIWRLTAAGRSVVEIADTR